MKLKLDLINCYGINRLSEELDFTKSEAISGVHSLYAPNGTLKTSLAKTFKDIEGNRDTSDQIFRDRVTTRYITVDGIDILANQVMVIDSYDESYSSKQLSTLLVNEKLKQQYDIALKEVDDRRISLIKALTKISGKQSKAVPSMICEAFSQQEKNMLELLIKLNHQTHADLRNYGSYKFNDLFNPKVIDLISSGDFHQELVEYVDTYEKLIEESTVLSKTFNHQKADDVSKSLNDTGFFTAEHTVNLSVDGVKQEISSREMLNELLKKEQDKVMQSPELREKFIKVDNKLKNRDTQSFRDFIAEHQQLLPEYKDLKLFQQKVIIGYLQSQQALWDDLTDTYQHNQELVENIIHQAQQQRTTWENVVDTFNNRFSVPFELSVNNQDEVILNGAAPAIRFEFNDGRGNTQEIDRESLIATLSQGEKRALYILNILFEIEIRKRQQHSVLIIIDDIADSFDYKNKYAIVEYLRDIAKIPYFNLLILTHNFDFHRIIGSRIIGSNNQAARSKRLLATKTREEIKLNKEKYQNDVLSTWKSQMQENEAFMLASVPFVRNLADYCGYKDHYLKLTSLLHIKSDSRAIKVHHLQAIYRDVFKDKEELTLRCADSKVIDKIFHYSDALILDANESPELESKVILAMAIRLKAEDFMIVEINEQEYVDNIKSNQTRQLFDRYTEKFPENEYETNLLDQVNLMTPENIHLNSFMYEPILDMSAHRLYDLYAGLQQLTDHCS